MFKNHLNRPSGAHDTATGREYAGVDTLETAVEMAMKTCCLDFFNSAPRRPSPMCECDL